MHTHWQYVQNSNGVLLTSQSSCADGLRWSGLNEWIEDFLSLSRPLVETALPQEKNRDDD